MTVRDVRAAKAPVLTGGVYENDLGLVLDALAHKPCGGPALTPSRGSEDGAMSAEQLFRTNGHLAVCQAVDFADLEGHSGAFSSTGHQQRQLRQISVRRSKHPVTDAGIAFHACRDPKIVHADSTQKLYPPLSLQLSAVDVVQSAPRPLAIRERHFGDPTQQKALLPLDQHKLADLTPSVARPLVMRRAHPAGQAQLHQHMAGGNRGNRPQAQFRAKNSSRKVSCCHDGLPPT